jgi:hypothetical protein
MSTELAIDAASPPASADLGSGGDVKNQNNRRRGRKGKASLVKPTTTPTEDAANKDDVVMGTADDIDKKQARRRRRGTGRTNKATANGEEKIAVAPEVLANAAEPTIPTTTAAPMEVDDVVEVDDVAKEESKKQATVLPQRRRGRKKPGTKIDAAVASPTLVTTAPADLLNEAVPAQGTDAPLDTSSPVKKAATKNRQRRRGQRTAVVAAIRTDQDKPMVETPVSPVKTVTSSPQQRCAAVVAPADATPTDTAEPTVDVSITTAIPRRRRGGPRTQVAKMAESSTIAKRVNKRLFTRAKGFDIWTTDAAIKAQSLRSNQEEGSALSVSFHNATSKDNVVVCWMDTEGIPKRYDRPTMDVSQDIPCGQVICFAVCNNLEQCKNDTTMDMILAAYRPRVPVKDLQIVTLVESKKQGPDSATPIYTIQVKSANSSRDEDAVVPMDVTDETEAE